MKWLHSRTAVVALVAVVAALTICLGAWQGWLAEAQTVRWVNDADDTGEPTECSTTTAYADIASALGASADGDIVRLCEGTYAGDVTIGVEVTIEGREGADRADVEIDIPAAAPTGGLIIGADNVTIQHLTLDGPDVGPVVGISSPAPGYSNLTISDVEVTEFHEGIRLDPAQDSVIELSHIHDNYVEGVAMLGGTRNEVRENDIVDNDDDGLEAHDEDELLVDRNTLSGNLGGQLDFNGLMNVRVFRNDIVTVAGSDGIQIKGMPADSLIQIGASADNANSFSGPFDPTAGDFYVELSCGAENTVDAIYNWWGSTARADIANRIYDDEDDDECASADSAVVFHPWATGPAPTPSPSPTPTPSPTPSPTVSPTPTATRTFDLPIGWNNFVWTGADGTAAETVFSCIAGPPVQFAIAYALDAGGWLRYVPDDPSITTLTTVDQYDSMLVLITASGVQCADMPVEP
jgi:hypothetical protein